MMIRERDRLKTAENPEQRTTNVGQSHDEEEDPAGVGAPGSHVGF